jgi:Family of unknown function (DUF6221)
VLTDAEIAFLRSQLDEDEKAAVAAARADGRYGGRPHWSPLGGGMVTDTEDPDWAVADLTPCIEDGDLAAHIARHDPARVLRDVAVWRHILLEYSIPPGTDARYGNTEREAGFRLALSAALKAKIATYDGNPVTGKPFSFGVSERLIL